MFRIILPKNIDVLVTSFGGVGTSFLMSYLAQFKEINSPADRDSLKHLPLPPVSFNPRVKFIYVHGDPRLAVISLFRRGYHYLQSYKLRSYELRLDIDSEAFIPKTMTVQEYAALGIDKFCFREHFYNWYNRLLTHETLFLRYETLFENVDSIFDFLDIPRKYVDSFPKKIDRASKKNEIPAETWNHLNMIYGDFYDELAELEDVEIRKRNSPISLMTTYLSKPYRNALIRDIEDTLEETNPDLYGMLCRFKGSSNAIGTDHSTD